MTTLPVYRKFECTDCALHEGVHSNCVPARRLDQNYPLMNPDKVEYLFVGEAPGEQEDKQGLPFVGASGIRLDDILKIIEVDPSKCAITNIARCRPPENRKPYVKEIRACEKYLEAEIDWIKPKLIIALGATPWKLLGDGSTLTKARLRRVDGKYGRAVATFHPAATLYDPSRITELAEDLESIFDQGIKDETITWKRVHNNPRLAESFSKAKYVILDIETKGLKIGAKLRIWGFNIPPSNTYYIVEGENEVFNTILKEKIEDPTVTFLGHFFKYDLSRLAYYLQVDNIRCRADDSIVLHYFMMEDSWGRSLERLSTIHTPFKDFKSETEALWRDNQIVPREQLRERCAYDVAATKLIYKDLTNILKERGDYSPSLVKLYSHMTPWVAWLESIGIAIDPKERDRQAKSKATNIRKLERRLREIAPDTLPTSPKQLCKLLFEEWKLSVVKKTPKGTPSTDAETLQELSESLELSSPLYYIDDLLEFRSESKILGTFIKQIPEGTTMVWPEYYMIKGESREGISGGTVTQRISIKNPAIQTFQVGPLRKMFVSRYSGGSIYGLDAAQMELRVAADLSGCKVLLGLFRNKIDVHSYVANLCGIPRRQAKTVVFAMIYDTSISGLVEKAGLDLYIATKVFHRLHEEWSELFEWFETNRQTILSTKRAVTKYGAIRRLPLASMDDPKGREAIRQGLNFLIQNPSSHLIQILGRGIMEYIDRRLFVPIMTHHDGLYFDCKNSGLNRIKKGLKKWRNDCVDMLEFMPDVPFGFEITAGPNWHDQKEVITIEV